MYGRPEGRANELLDTMLEENGVHIFYFFSYQLRKLQKIWIHSPQAQDCTIKQFHLSSHHWT